MYDQIIANLRNSYSHKDRVEERDKGEIASCERRVAMTKKTSAVATPSLTKRAVVPAYIFPDRRSSIRALWFSLTLVIIAGLVISGVIALIINYLLKNTHFFPAMTNTALPAVTTLNVQRTSLYAGLEITVKNAQYASSFADDDIPSSSGVVRLNMQITNPTANPVGVLYYDVARLLAPHMQPFIPSNVHLSDEVQPNKIDTGWIDFSLPGRVQLDTLSLQLGSASLHETMVVIPLQGSFDPTHFFNKSFPQSLLVPYNFNGNLLSYHLKLVDVLYAYQGNQAKAGQQFYVFNFLVDNPNGIDVAPGFGYDYIRLVVQGYSQPPSDSTLPATFKRGSHSVSGQVVFAAPAKMKALTIGFRSQSGGSQQNYVVNL
jgi:hypothetical protein